MGREKPTRSSKLPPRRIIPFNTDKEGNSRTITTMYARLGVNNCTPDFDKSGGGLRATAILEIWINPE